MKAQSFIWYILLYFNKFACTKERKKSILKYVSANYWVVLFHLKKKIVKPCDESISFSLNVSWDKFINMHCFLLYQTTYTCIIHVHVLVLNFNFSTNTYIHLLNDSDNTREAHSITYHMYLYNTKVCINRFWKQKEYYHAVDLQGIFIEIPNKTDRHPGSDILKLRITTHTVLCIVLFSFAYAQNSLWSRLCDESNYNFYNGLFTSKWITTVCQFLGFVITYLL